MSVLIDNRQDFIEIDSKMESFVEKVVNQVLEFEECQEEYETSISFVGNEEIQELNLEYREIDAPTDVLSFCMLEFEDEDTETAEEDEEVEYIDEELALGDIVISIEKAIEQAEEYGHSLERELAFLLIHGMLHLLGYDHDNEQDEKIMLEKQTKILEILKISR